MEDLELIREYERLMQKSDNGTFTHMDAVDLVAIVAELGARGYIRTPDDSTWILKPSPN